MSGLGFIWKNKHGCRKIRRSVRIYQINQLRSEFGEFFRVTTKVQPGLASNMHLMVARFVCIEPENGHKNLYHYMWT